jgi:hypothetical protein
MKKVNKKYFVVNQTSTASIKFMKSSGVSHRIIK